MWPSFHASLMALCMHGMQRAAEGGGGKSRTATTFLTIGCLISLAHLAEDFVNIDGFLFLDFERSHPTR